MIREIYAKKIGMTQLFDEMGNVIPATLLEIEPVYILEKIEYPTKVRARIGCFKMDEKKAAKLKKPVKGYFNALSVPAYRLIREVEVETGADFSFLSKDAAADAGEELTEKPSAETQANDAAEPQAAPEKGKPQESEADTDSPPEPQGGDPRLVGIEIFNEGQRIDVQGLTKGKGFAGGMKRHGWSGQPKSHGSMTHRRIGSAGASTYPAKIIKGHRMPGHMGNKRRTTKNLKVIKIDKEKGIMFISGCLPGPRGALVRVRKVG